VIFQVMPALSDADYAALKADIDERGLMVPIEVDEDGNILDGHHRQKICNELGILCSKTIRYGLDEAGKRTHARRLNIARRHLNSEQKRELIADELRDDAGRSNLAISNALGVDDKTVAVVRQELERVSEIPKQETRKGKDGKNYKAKKPARPTGYLLIDDSDEGIKAVKARVKDVRATEQAESREKRIEHIAEISKGNTELGTTSRYPVIYADPPWRYENPPMGGTNRSIENHYPTMSLDEICAMPVTDLATDDAILYLWATAPKLAECMKVIEAWGFEYRTNMVWDKMKIGMGYHARNQHELLLIAKRGQIPPPKAGEQPASVIRIPRGKHSAKPVEFYEIIEKAYPELLKIELFCRSPREGWAVWGNQSGAAA